MSTLEIDGNSLKIEDIINITDNSIKVILQIEQKKKCPNPEK